MRREDFFCCKKPGGRHSAEIECVLVKNHNTDCYMALPANHPLPESLGRMEWYISHVTDKDHEGKSFWIIWVGTRGIGLLERRITRGDSYIDCVDHAMSGSYEVLPR